MKRFLVQTLLFLFPLIILLIAGDAFISNALRKVQGYTAGELSVWDDVYSGKVDADIVIYGSSRAWTQIDPFILADSLGGRVYNLGIDGHNFRMQYLRHSVFLKHNRKPKLIIHSVDVFTLMLRPDMYNEGQLLPFIYHDKEVNKTARMYEGYSYFDYLLPGIRYYGKSSAVFAALKPVITGKEEAPLRINGYHGSDKTWNNDFEKAREQMSMWTARVDTPSVIAFEQYIQECKRKDIKLILVYVPEHKEGQEFVSNRKEVLDIYYNFSKKYHIPFYNYSDDSICYQKKYFYNASHMNRSGSELFSREFASQLKHDGF